MLAIRLQRTGRKHEPTFRVVLTDSKNGPKSGKYLENLGWYDTRIKNAPEQIDTEKVKYWISKGAQPSVTLHNFLVSKKIIEGKKINALPKKTVQKKAEEAVPPSQSFGGQGKADAKPAAAPASTPENTPPIA